MDTNSYQVHALQRIDTIYRHDSVFIHERVKGDTVYLTRTEWRDRWRIREVHDTIRDTQYVTHVVEKPPRHLDEVASTLIINFNLLTLCKF